MSHESASQTTRRLHENHLQFDCLALDGSHQPVLFQAQKLVIAGWAGRDAASLEAHIQELELLGVSRPKKTPEFYQLSASLLSHASTIQVIGEGSSGEVECVLLGAEGKLYVGLGSDHTDRKAEVFGVALSKQLCPKPVAEEVWAYEDVVDHWDELILRSHTVSAGKRTLYQEGRVAQLLHPRELLLLYRNDWNDDIGDGAAMFSGTIPVYGSIACGGSFHMELHDPVLGRSIEREYDVQQLPLAAFRS